MRQIKFQVWCKGELFGYERLTENGWEWMCIPLNPDGGERWIPGIMGTSESYKRRMWTGLKDCKGVDIYESDIVDIEYRGKRFTGVVTWNQQSASFIFKNEKRYCEIVSMAASGDGYNVKLDNVEVTGNKFQHPNLLTNSANQ